MSPIRIATRRQPIRRGIALALVMCAPSACSLPKDMNDVAGTYVMHQRWAADTIRLRADGHYVRTFQRDHETAARDSGRWFLSKNRRLVALRDFPKRWPFVHDLMTDAKGLALLQPTTLALTIERSRLGKRRLGWHSQFGWWYDRLSNRSE
ncbi:hypothetical protein BH09GEM1_BH09GEM1_25070 [soil metagenome]